MITHLSPQALADPAAAGQKVIDVRSAAEFATGHIPGSINVPMEQVEAREPDIGNGPVVLVCEAGKRAELVAGWLQQKQSVSVLAGGTAAWRTAGLPLVKCASCRWTLERQVRFAAGAIVLLSSVLAVAANVRWAYLAMFVGAGLTFAGVTNICGMAVVLARMPWNRSAKAKSVPDSQVAAKCCSS
jgi:rhodanese-related sulfurtransferase